MKRTLSPNLIPSHTALGANAHSYLACYPSHFLDTVALEILERLYRRHEGLLRAIAAC